MQALSRDKSSELKGREAEMVQLQVGRRMMFHL